MTFFRDILVPWRVCHQTLVFRLSLTVEKRCSHGIHAKLFDPFPILVLAARKVSENTQKKWLRFNDDYYNRKQAKERRFVFEGKYSGVIQCYKAYCGFGYLVPDDPLDTMPPGVREAIESNQWHGLYFRGIDLAVSWSWRWWIGLADGKGLEVCEELLCFFLTLKKPCFFVPSFRQLISVSKGTRFFYYYNYIHFFLLSTPGFCWSKNHFLWRHCPIESMGISALKNPIQVE